MLDVLTTRDDALSAGAAKAEIERSLPAWHAERHRLRQERVQRRDTPYADRLVVGFVRAAGVAIAIGVAVVLGEVAYSSWGAAAGIAAGVLGLAVALGAASATVRLARMLFARGARTHLANVERLDIAIHGLDERIDGAFRVHGLDARPSI